MFACGSYDNRSWNSVRATGISADERCPGSATMGNAVGGGARVPLGATGTTTFTAPAGMTIADFTLTRQLTYRNGAPADGTRRLYAIYKLGGTVFAGAGRYENATRNRLNAVGSWYGYPENNVVVPTEHGPALELPGARGLRRRPPRRCRSRSAASTAASTPPARWPRGGGISHLLSGAQVVLNDPTPPRRVDRGLGPARRRRGARAADPITLDASDNGGIRRVEIIDVTAGGSQRRRRRGLRGRRAHRHRRDLLVPPAQGLPEPQERDRAPDRAWPPGRGR